MRNNIAAAEQEILSVWFDDAGNLCAHHWDQEYKVFPALQEAVLFPFSVSLLPPHPLFILLSSLINFACFFFNFLQMDLHSRYSFVSRFFHSREYLWVSSRLSGNGQYCCSSSLFSVTALSYSTGRRTYIYLLTKMNKSSRNILVCLFWTYAPIF